MTTEERRNMTTTWERHYSAGAQEYDDDVDDCDWAVRENDDADDM